MQFEKSSAKQGKSTRSRQKKAIDMPPDLDWTNAKNIEDALKDVHEVVTKRAHELIKYYDEAIPGRRIRAKAVRMAQLVLSILVGIGLVAAAVLIPLHPELYIVGVVTGAILVIAVALTLLDGLCGYSGSWMRYTTACQSVLSVLDQFEIQWQIHLCTVQPRNITNNEAITVLDTTKEFLKNMDYIVTIETRHWIAEFSLTLNNIETQLKTYQEEVDKILNP